MTIENNNIIIWILRELYLIIIFFKNMQNEIFIFVAFFYFMNPMLFGV